MVFIFGVHIFGMARSFLALCVLLWCVPVYISMGIDSRLPKRILLPLVLYVVWANFGCFPLPLYFDPRWVGIAASLVQAGFSALAFYMIRKSSDGSWLLTPQFFTRPVFNLKNTALFTLGNIVLIPVVAGLLITSSVHQYLNSNTAGFMYVGSGGLYLQERTYNRDDKKIHLVAMIHIGSREYYEQLSQFLSSSDTIVLAEGVTDTTGLMKEFPSYEKIANLIGLETQENMVIHGKLIEYEDISKIDVNEFGKEHEATIVRADIDSKDLSKDAVEFIQSVGLIFKNNGSLISGLTDYLNWYKENMTPEQEEIILDEIINKRNSVLLHYLDEAIKHYDTIVIPWGAMHMPGLEQAVLKRNFTAGDRISRLAVGFDSFVQPAHEDGLLQ